MCCTGHPQEQEEEGVLNIEEHTFKCNTEDGDRENRFWTENAKRRIN
jgi:hypothetical protein